MIRITVLATCLAVAGLVAFVCTRPSTVHVERSAAIRAPILSVYQRVADLRLWSAWSPWELRDPNMRSEYSGARQGVGSTLAWQGNRDVGQGSLTIIDTQPPSTIRLVVDMKKPFADHSTATFAFYSVNATTTLCTWSMEKSQNFLAKAIGLVFDMDQRIGTILELGLTRLKSVVERPPSVINTQDTF